jgi:hypothetical protein
LPSYLHPCEIQRGFGRKLVPTRSSCHNQLQLITGSVILRGDINHFKVIVQHLPKFVDALNKEIPVLSQMKCGKAPGKDELRIEMYKTPPSHFLQVLVDFLNKVMERGQTVVRGDKYSHSKGWRQTNYRGITYPITSFCFSLFHRGDFISMR